MDLTLGPEQESVRDAIRGMLADRLPLARIRARPEVDDDVWREAGELAIPFTTGMLMGIGETSDERVATLLAIRELSDRYGHIQEAIIQPFKLEDGMVIRIGPYDLTYIAAAPATVVAPPVVTTAAASAEPVSSGRAVSPSPVSNLTIDDILPPVPARPRFPVPLPPTLRSQYLRYLPSLFDDGALDVAHALGEPLRRTTGEVLQRSDGEPLRRSIRSHRCHCWRALRASPWRPRSIPTKEAYRTGRVPGAPSPA